MHALICDDSIHYLDHLAPFCALNDFPLTVFDPELFELGCQYYPNLSILLSSWDTFQIPPHLLTCDPLFFLRSYFGQLWIEPEKVYWLPHGYSDKGWKSHPFRALSSEIVLAYGPAMETTILESNPSLRILQVGNFRLDYFLQHRPFYERQLPAYPNSYLFYAPTWEDLEEQSSLWSVVESLATHTQHIHPLLIKPHPNTQKRFPAELEILKGRLERTLDSPPFWIDKVPTIYPLLAKAAAYIGDVSSIGYDYLFFNRPMWFTPTAGTPTTLPLYQCGTILPLDPADWPLRDLQTHLTHRRKILYQSVYTQMNSKVGNLTRR
jgi:hypothetical protein